MDGGEILEADNETKSERHSSAELSLSGSAGGSGGVGQVGSGVEPDVVVGRNGADRMADELIDFEEHSFDCGNNNNINAEMEVESGTSESKLTDSTAPDIDAERQSKRKKSLEATPDGAQGAQLEMAGDEEGAGAGAGDEIMQTEKVINAIRYYRKYGHAKLRHFVTVFKSFSKEHQTLLTPLYCEHLKNMKFCIDQNQRVLKEMLSYGLEMFIGDDSLRSAAAITQLRPSTELFMSKVKSILKQIVRDWSHEGLNERTVCYETVLEAVRARFPDATRRPEIKILVPGAGLGRLAWQLVMDGFSVQGAEFSLFMLFTSNFILNKCCVENEYTIHPYVLDTCNNWSYEDQLRAVKFPDLCPSTDSSVRSNTFSMSAGDFLETTVGEEGQWDVVVTVFFVDTAANILNYIDAIHRILKRGGLWINFGPLTYHFADMEDEMGIELPYSEVIRLIREKGFRIERDDRRDAVPATYYACNERSMLRYQYSCGCFECIKL